MSKNLFLFFSFTFLLINLIHPALIKGQDVNRALKNFWAGNYQPAAREFADILPGVEKHFGQSDTTTYSKIVLYTAISFERIGDIQRAKHYYEKCNTIYEDINTEMNHLYAVSCINLGRIYEDFGYYNKAEPLLLRAKSMREKLFGKQHLDYAQSVNNLGGLYHRQGKDHLAEPLLLESYEIYQKKLGREHTEYALSCNNLGLLYQDLGNYQKAEKFFLEAYRIFSKYQETKKSDFATICNNFAGLYHRTGDYRKAESLFITSKNLIEEINGKMHPLYAKIISNLGLLYKDMGNLSEAISLVAESKDIRLKILGNKNPDYAQSCLNLSSLYMISGKQSKSYNERKNAYLQAEMLLLEAKTIYEEVFGKEGAVYANVCNNLASVYADLESVYQLPFEKQSALKKAGEAYHEAFEILKKTYGDFHPKIAANCNNLARYYQKVAKSSMGKEEKENALQKAESYYLLSNRINRFFLNETARFMSEEQRERYINSRVSYFFDAYHSFYFKKRPENEKLPGIIYDNALSLKGQLLRSGTAIRQAIHQSNDTSLVNKYLELNALGKLLDNQYNLPKTKRRKDFDLLKEKLNNLEKGLVQKASKLAWFKKQHGLTSWQLIKNELKNDETAIEFIKFEYFDETERQYQDLYYALILSKEFDYPKAQFLFEEKQLFELLERTGHESDFEYVKRLYSPLSLQSDKLYTLIFKPLESYLKGTKRLYISPTGLLNRVAFDAIVKDSSKIILDNYDLIYLSSTSYINEKHLQTKEIDDIALFGGVEYDLSKEEMVSTARSFRGEDNEQYSKINFSEIDGAESQKIDSLSRNVNWSYLPGSLEETKEIKETLNDKNVSILFYTEKQANEEQFKALENNAPAVIHVSTHGFYFGDDKKSEMYKEMIDDEVNFAHSSNPLLRSGFILAGGNRAFQGKEIPGGVEDGVLTALEISRLNFFTTKLAVLSACQTGLGDVKGSEGVYGLQRAFKMAGVDYLLFSLWEVPDYQTKELMTNFYANWFSGMEIREAFKKAQLYLKNKYAKMEGSAFAWAAFVLMN